VVKYRKIPPAAAANQITENARIPPAADLKKKKKKFYFTHPPRKHDFSHILPSCLLFIAESRKYHPVVVLLHNNQWLKKISTMFHQVLKQCSVFYLRYCVLRYFVKLPPYVFRLQYPRVLHS
jgi:hypothetical protein